MTRSIVLLLLGAVAGCGDLTKRLIDAVDQPTDGGASLLARQGW